MRIELQHMAQADLQEGYDYYEERDSGWGDYFWKCIYEDLAELARLAGFHSRKGGFFWAHSRIFPWSIYYDLRDGVVKVYAIMDDRRRPAWRNRELRRRRPT